MPTALITGITGQDGSYLAELLLAKGYRVVGVARRSSTVTNERIEHLLDDITVVQGDLTDQGSLLSLIEEYKPTEVYNLAAQSFVPTSWNQPALTGDITAQELRLGNLESQRDWGFAGDYVKAMWCMLQQDTPGNFVIGMGETHSVREFCEIAFGHVDLDYKEYVVQDERFYRPAEVDLLISDPSKARSILSWEPEINFKELVTMMVDSDMKRLSQKR